MILRNLLRRPTRTLLTIVGIAVGIAAIVTLVSLAQGLITNYIQATNRTDADVILQAVQKREGQAISFGIGFDEGLADRVRAMPEVKDASSVIYTLARAEGMPFFIIFGYEPDQPGIRHFHVTEGVTLAEYRSRRGGKPLLLGKAAADRMKKGVGDTIRIEEMTFRIVGIYETGIAFEDSAAVIPLRDAQTLAGMPHQVMFIGIRLRQPDRVEEFKEKLARLLPRDVEIAGTQVGSMMLELLSLFDVYAWSIAIVAALVGGVGMMNTMLMSVFERTREIGVLRAVGWRPRRVMGMILGESLLLSLVGGLLGLALGAAMAYIVPRLPGMAGLTRGTVPPKLALQALTTALLLGSVGGAYPAWRASRLTPVEALSYDGGASRRGAWRIPWGGMAVRNLGRQRTRTMLTLLGVGLGVMTMILIGGLTEGAIRSFNSIVSGVELTMAQKDQPDTSLSVIDERILKRIEALPEVQYVSGIIMTAVSTPKNPFFMITARSRNDPALKPRLLKEGTLLTGPRQCLVGWRAAIEQGVGIGDRMQMLGTSFTVVGIIQTGNALEDGGAIIDLREAQRLLNKPRQVMIAQIKLRDPYQTEEMLTRLSAEYPDMLFTRSAEFTQSLPDMENARKMFNAIYGVAAIVGAIALMNTMMMSVYERTREIGVLRAVGWRQSLVMRQMLAEAILLTLISGLVGFLLSEGMIQLMRLNPAASIYKDIFAITPGVAVQGILFCVVLGVLGGLYPAWRATRFSPVEALRYE